MKTSIPFLLLSFSLPATWAIQPGAAPAQPAPLRDLEFGDINFLHTTDTHGWHAGHLLEPSFSADWGDYVSFSEHLRNGLEADGRDLLVIDTGDRIEGNGLYDSSSPRGLYTFPIFKNQQMDIICVGNHELYKNSSAEDDYTKLVPYYKDHYLASNLRIVDPQTGQEVQVSSRYRLFTTKKKGIRILAFGFIFDFNRNAKNTQVQLVEDVVQEPWFTEAVVSNEVDLIIVIGHVALRSFEFGTVYRAIRQMKHEVPIQFFGGHYHIRDYRIYDLKAHALASGRFMETIGFQSITNLSSPAPKFFRSYIDNNLYSFYHHSKKDSYSFVTEQGRITTEAITSARNTLNLDETFGCADQTYWMSRVPYPHNSSIYTLLTDSILPDLLNMNPDRRNKTRLLLTNTGAIRFDIFAGPFTRDSTFIVSPFTSNLSYISDVPYRYAKQLLPILNNGDPAILEALYIATWNQKFKFFLHALPPPEQSERNLLRPRSPRVRKEQDSRPIPNGQASEHHDDGSDFYESEAQDDDYLNHHIGPRTFQYPLTQNQNTKDKLPPLTPGYTTSDDLGTTGDDTIHSPINFYNVPNVIQSLVPGPNSSIPANEMYTIPLDQDDNRIATSRSTSNSKSQSQSQINDNEPIDVVFNQFLTPYIIHILNILPYIVDTPPSPSDSDTAADTQKATLLAYEPYRENMYWITSPTKLPCVFNGSCPDLKPPKHVRAALDAEIARDKLVIPTVVGARKYTEGDVQNYVPGETFTTLLAGWVGKNWRGNCEGGVREGQHGEL